MIRMESLFIKDSQSKFSIVYQLGIRKQFLLACSTLEDEKNSRMKNTEDSLYILKEQV